MRLAGRKPDSNTNNLLIFIVFRKVDLAGASAQGVISDQPVELPDQRVVAPGGSIRINIYEDY